MNLSRCMKWIPFGKVPEVAPTELNNLLQTGVQIVDVRTAEEWRHSHIRTAINLPITQFSQANIDALNLKKDVPIVTICLSAHRSIPAVRQLQSLGYTQVFQLKQGMRHWWQLELPCECEEKE